MTEIEKDKYKAVWLSHSSIGDYLKCPRLYFLRNVYKNPLSRRKFTIMNPPLALGQVVHEVIESLSFLPTNERFQYPLHKNFEVSWQKVGGEKGGFRNHEQESEYKDRGLKMLKNLEENPGPILMKALKSNRASLMHSEARLHNPYFKIRYDTSNLGRRYRRIASAVMGSGSRFCPFTPLCGDRIFDRLDRGSST